MPYVTAVNLDKVTKSSKEDSINLFQWVSIIK